MTQTSVSGWQFTDSRGQLVSADAPPTRIAAYIQAGATLWDHGLRPLGIFGSHHDGPTPDPAKSGRLPLADLAYYGAGASIDPDEILASGADLLVAVSYGGGAVYGLEPDAAKHLEQQIPVVVIDVGQGRSLSEVRENFTELAASLGGAETPDVDQRLADAQAKLKSLISPETPAILALSPASASEVHLARPQAWPDLRALTALGVPLLSPPPEGGVNWATVGWEAAAALAPRIVLTDVRANAAPLDPARLNPAGVDPAAPGTGVRVLPWNPELPASSTAHTGLFDDIAAALQG
ncbi:ABC transporter substrate-binding protein [Streptomyces sp. NPDC091272]|uniref:ABC transporter substrate-binding protein n=1 Tax=Streptomyces sp. NPDC091272 TaxID=3365981 RepID=UPI0038057BA0